MHGVHLVLLFWINENLILFLRDRQETSQIMKEIWRRENFLKRKAGCLIWIRNRGEGNANFLEVKKDPGQK